MKQDRVYHIQSFEENSIPSNWQANNQEALTLSTKHYKMGKQSLKWSFKEGDYIVVTEEENMLGASKSKRGGLITWIYNEQPINKCLSIKLGTKEQIKEDNVPYTFEFYLNFKGWRALWVNFREDIVNPDFMGDHTGLIEQMIIHAPEIDGDIYLDVVEFVDTIYECRTQDYQIMIPRPDSIGRTFWQKSYEYIHKKCSLPLESLTDKQVEAFEIVEKRLEDWIMGTNRYTEEVPLKMRRKALDEYIAEGVRLYEGLEIKKDKDGTITGVPLFASRAPYEKKFGVDVSTPIFLPLVFDYKLNHNEESFGKLMLLFDYYNDQGWAEGSGLGTLDHETNRSSGYFLAVYLMREELKVTGRFERECKTVEWYSDFGKLNGDFGIDYIETTADEFRTHFLYRLLYILTIETSPRKVQAIENYLKWVNTALEVTHNFAGTIKPDYTGYHHRGIYASAYAPQGYHMAALINYILHGTLFEIGKVGRLNLKKALVTQDILSHEYDLAQSLTGRFPEETGILVKILPAYTYMALSGNPETGEVIDHEMVSIFKRHWDRNSSRLQETLFAECKAGISYIDTLGGMELMLDIEGLETTSGEEVNGFFVKPYGGLVAHRYKNWMVLQKGWSQYIWDYESGGKKQENVYGRYVSYGALQIMAHKEPKLDGYEVMRGWNWNLVPGATTKHLPWNELDCSVNDYAHRTFTDQTFLGGVSNQNEQGIFGMILHDTQYDTSFEARKSSFYFEDEIICLGSDISNIDKKNRTQTTLFQAYIGEDKSLDGYVNSTSPMQENELKLQTDKETWIMDPYGNGYWIAQNQMLEVRKGIQDSRDSFDKEETTGKYVTAWLSHGKAPSKAAYEYVIKVQTDIDTIANYKKSYEVIAQDASAHILNYPKYQTTGYVIFEPNKAIEYGILEGTDTPILAMAKEVKDGIVLSICDPDLRLPKLPNQEMTELTAAIPSKAKTVQISLKGCWQALSKDIKKIEHTGDSTILEVNFRDGKTVEVILKNIIKN